MFSKKLITSIGGLLITASAVLAFPETPRRIEISAKKFSYSPNEITLKKDEPVVLVFHSED
jgi:cytochrome c oxidase subunit 2